MLLRQAVLAAILVSGTAAAAVAQSGQFPFRHFVTRRPDMPRFETRPDRFSLRDQDRFQERADRLRLRLDERSHMMADRMRMRAFEMRDMGLRMRDRAFEMRNRAFFERRDEARSGRMEFRFQDGERMRDRIRDRIDHFRLERPMMRRHSGAI